MIIDFQNVLAFFSSINWKATETNFIPDRPKIMVVIQDKCS